MTRKGIAAEVFLLIPIVTACLMILCLTVAAAFEGSKKAEIIPAKVAEVRPTDLRLEYASGVQWIGYLPIGAKDSKNPGQPYPIAGVLPDLQMGLRDDGTLMWRRVKP